MRKRHHCTSAPSPSTKVPWDHSIRRPNASEPTMLTSCARWDAILKTQHSTSLESATNNRSLSQAPACNRKRSASHLHAERKSAILKQDTQGVQKSYKSEDNEHGRRPDTGQRSTHRFLHQLHRQR